MNYEYAIWCDGGQFDISKFMFNILYNLCK